MSRGWDDATGVVTPEAVELRFHDATVGSRGAAVLLDFTILGLTSLALNLTIGWLAERAQLSTSGWVATTVLIVVNFLLVFGYPIAFETLWHGRTPGKAALGLRAVTVEGSPVRFRHAAIRGAFWLVDFFGTVGVAAVLASLFSKRQQRLGDMVAGTVVLRERSASQAPRTAQYEVRPGMAEYAATLDVSALPAADYEVVREFLLRERGLSFDRRHEIAGRLARAIGQKLQHQPPPGVSQVDFLTCVASRYQQQRQGRATAVPQPPPPESVGQPPAGDEPWQDFAPPA